MRKVCCCFSRFIPSRGPGGHGSVGKKVRILIVFFSKHETTTQIASTNAICLLIRQSDIRSHKIWVFHKSTKSTLYSLQRCSSLNIATTQNIDFEAARYRYETAKAWLLLAIDSRTLNLTVPEQYCRKTEQTFLKEATRIKPSHREPLGLFWSNKLRSHTKSVKH